jgi:hypothetical protein
MLSDTDASKGWPPGFTLDQERILRLLTGDRFYSDASAALREAILNAIDAAQRHLVNDPYGSPDIQVIFDRTQCRLTIHDNGVGMDREAILDFFTKIGASAATLDSKHKSVGEFGIGVISYFMAGDSFSIETFDGTSEPVALSFNKEMLAGAPAQEFAPTRSTRGTTLIISLRDAETFKLLLEKFPYWCRAVSGLNARLLPEDVALDQGTLAPLGTIEDLPKPDWIESSNIAPVADPIGWNAMSGDSSISVLYRGVFVQEFRVRRLWGIQGSINVDPKYFKPRLNREGFVTGQFQADIEEYLKGIHPSILTSMAAYLQDAIQNGKMDQWSQRRWATLWLSVPRGGKYATTVKAWDSIFRALPAFEVAEGNKWNPLSLDELLTLGGPIFIAPHPDEKPNEIVNAAVRLLRHSSKVVVRGLKREGAWLRHIPSAFTTTADLIVATFGSELPELVHVSGRAEEILAGLARIASLYSDEPAIDLVKLGSDGPPLLRLRAQLIINIENEKGRAIVDSALIENGGRWALIAITARVSNEHLSQVAAAVRSTPTNEVLGLVKRRYLRGLLS